MVRITEALVRKSAEHNEGMISTLIELSLHQRNIDKIQHLDKWCKRLQILYLQGNIIGKLENLSRLRELVYLNVCLNNIKKIENLEGCEALEKLDLTCNFVADPLELEHLIPNTRLKEIYLLGNPLTDVEGWRDFVVAVLPQLDSIDGTKITRAERIKANQLLPEIRSRLVELAATRPEEEPESSDDDADEDEEDEEEEEPVQPSQRGKYPRGVKSGSVSDHWAAERERFYNKQYTFVRNGEENPKQGDIACVEVHLEEFQPVVAANNARTLACVMEGPLTADAMSNMAGARFTAVVRCAMENRAVDMLMGEWVAVFERLRRQWSLCSLKPRDQVEREASEVKKPKKIPKDQISKNTPQERIDIAEEQERQAKEKEEPNPKEIKAQQLAEKSAKFKFEIEQAKADKEKDQPTRPKQRNEGKWEFSLDETKNSVVLEVGVPKFLDTSMIDLEVEPTWVAMEIKGKQFLIHLPQEVNTENTKAERSQNSGALVLTMPFVGQVLGAETVLLDRKSAIYQQNDAPIAPEPFSNSLRDESIGVKCSVDVTTITRNATVVAESFNKITLDSKQTLEKMPAARAQPKQPSKGFVDNMDVPPLE